MVFQFQNLMVFNKIGFKATEFWFSSEVTTQHYHQVTVDHKDIEAEFNKIGKNTYFNLHPLSFIPGVHEWPPLAWSTFSKWLITAVARFKNASQGTTRQNLKPASTWLSFTVVSMQG